MNKKRLNYKKVKKFKKTIQIVNAIIFILLIALSIFSTFQYRVFNQQVGGSIQTYGLIGLFFIIFFIEFLPQLLNPYIALFAGIAAGFNVHLIYLSIFLGSILGSFLGFVFGKRYGLDFVKVLFEKKTLNKIIKFWDKYGNWFVFLGAVTPLPYLPMIFGALDMKRRDFIFYGVIPRLIELAVWCYGFYFGIIIWK